MNSMVGLLVRIKAAHESPQLATVRKEYSVTDTQIVVACIHHDGRTPGLTTIVAHTDMCFLGGVFSAPWLKPYDA